MLSAGGCRDSAENDAAPVPTTTAATSAPAASTYVKQVNDLCSQLLSKVLAFDIGNNPTIEQFESKRRKLIPLIEAFDRDVEAIPVTSAERSAAAAFDAYRRFSDAADARLVAAAATGDQEKFDAANDAFLRDLKAGPVELEDLGAVGIQCNAR